MNLRGVSAKMRSLRLVNTVGRWKCYRETENGERLLGMCAGKKLCVHVYGYSWVSRKDSILGKCFADCYYTTVTLNIHVAKETN